jgi:hypothetical protein
MKVKLMEKEIIETIRDVNIYKQNFILDSYITGYFEFCVVEECYFTISLQPDEEFRNYEDLIYIAQTLEAFVVDHYLNGTKNPTVFWYKITKPFIKVWDALANTPRNYAVACNGAMTKYIPPSL